MAKYFLGSVGKAEAFKRGDDGSLQLAFVSKTLTDSGINISTTKDDIRGGEGAPVQFSFYHDSNVEITLTDVLWKVEYLEAQLGARFNESDNQDYVTETVTFTNGAATLNNLNKMPLPCGEEYVVWGAKKGTDAWEKITVENTESPFALKLSGTHSGDEDYCVRYLGEVDAARAAEITSTIIPEELFLIITAPIFAGDACAASRGRAAGHITFEVPRFQLNGAQEFAMNMSQNQTMSLAGVALASESADCDANGGKLLRIIEVIDNRDWRDSVVDLIVDEECLVSGSVPAVYGEMKDGSLRKIANTDLTFAPALAAGKFSASGSTTITLKDRTGSTTIATETVTVAA